MTIEFEDWLDYCDFPTTEVGGEEYLILSKEEGDLLNTRHRVKSDDLYDMFGEVIEQYHNPDAVEADALLERAAPNPDADDEHGQADLGYEDIIEDWEERGLIQ